MTQLELSAAADVGLSTLGNYESGRRVPDVVVAARLADVLGVTVSDLVGDGKAAPAAQLDPVVWVDGRFYAPVSGSEAAGLDAPSEETVREQVAKGRQQVGSARALSEQGEEAARRGQPDSPPAAPPPRRGRR